MNLTKSFTSLVIITLVLAATEAAGATQQPVAARQRQRQGRQETCQGKYSIGGTADLVIADGTLVYPDTSKDHCQYGVTLLAEGVMDIRIKCCVKKTCGKDFIGVCQDKHKNCKGSLVVGRDSCLMEVPKVFGSCVFGTATDFEAEIENPCPAAGQCCIPDCQTGGPKPLCKDFPEDPCCTNTNTQSSLPQPVLSILNNEYINNNDIENYDLSSSSSSSSSSPSPSLQEQTQVDPSFFTSSSDEFLLSSDG